MSVTIFTNQEQEALSGKWTWARFQFFPGGGWVFGQSEISGIWRCNRLVGFLNSLYLLLHVLLHETAHQTLAANRQTGIWLGRIIGPLSFVPYTVYCESYIRHHAYLKKPHDW